MSAIELVARARDSSAVFNATANLELPLAWDAAYLGSNCRHLYGMKRLSRCALLDAQSAGREKKNARACPTELGTWLSGVARRWGNRREVGGHRVLGGILVVL